MRSSEEKRQSPSGSGKILRRIGIAAAVIAVLAGMEFAASGTASGLPLPV